MLSWAILHGCQGKAMCVAVQTVVLPELNIKIFINGVLEGRTRAYCSTLHTLQPGPPGRILVIGQIIRSRVQVI